MHDVSNQFQMPYLLIQEFEVCATLIFTICFVLALSLLSPGGIIPSPCIIIIFIVIVCRAL